MRRSSIARILVSKVELKHTSDKIVINLYVFNRQKTFYLKKIKRLTRFIPIPFMIYEKKNKYLEKRSLNIIKMLIDKYVLFNIKNKTVLHKHFKFINNKLIKMSFKVEKLYLLLKRNLYINNGKFRSTYIVPLIKLLEKIYKKKILFNIVSLKYPYLDSNIYLQLIMIKLRSRKNRIIRVMNKSMSKIKILRRLKLITLTDIFVKKPHRQDTSLQF